jgi:hypothetical protein
LERVSVPCSVPLLKLTALDWCIVLFSFVQARTRSRV